MIAHVWSILCSQAIIDRETNNVSIWNAIEQITIAAEPKPRGVVPIRFDIATLCVRSDMDVPAKGNLRIILSTPSGEDVQLNEAPIDLINYERARNITQIQGLPANESGIYIIKIELKQDDEWEQVAKIPVSIVFQPPEATKSEVESKKLAELGF
jgi:hypothetical protein